MKLTSLAAAAAAAILGLYGMPEQARADCPGGVDSPTCVTGSVHRLGANLRCFKVAITPVAPGDVRFGALVYGQLPAGAPEGMEKLLQEGAVLSVISDMSLSSDQCGDGTFSQVTGTRAIGY